MAKRRINPITGKLDELGSDAESIRGRAIDTGIPADGEVLVYDITSNTWIPQIATAFPRIAWQEVPSGAINGVNTTFTLSQVAVSNNVLVSLNGVILERVTTPSAINEFSHTAGTAVITLGDAPISGDFLAITYAF